MEIIIKNMVCPRCVDAVKKIFEETKVSIRNIQLGKVQTEKEVTIEQKQQLQERLAIQGFKLLDNKQTQLINEIKSIIIQQIHYSEEPLVVNFSTLLKEKMSYDYAYLSRLFSSVEGRTIEKFILAQKVEKIKELLTYQELSLSEIAFQLNYSSAAHLSSQFKKLTGMTPSKFKQLQQQERRSLDKI